MNKKLIPFAFASIGIIAGGILGTIGLLVWYVVSGEFLGVMAGSGFYGLLGLPLVSLICGGVPGAIGGAILGIVLGMQIK